MRYQDSYNIAPPFDSYFSRSRALFRPRFISLRLGFRNAKPNQRAVVRSVSWSIAEPRSFLFSWSLVPLSSRTHSRDPATRGEEVEGRFRTGLADRLVLPEVIVELESFSQSPGGRNSIEKGNKMCWSIPVATGLSVGKKREAIGNAPDSRAMVTESTATLTSGQASFDTSISFASRWSGINAMRTRSS
jgi:hypothetical protein